MKRMFRYNTGVIKQTSHIDDWATNDVRIMLQAIMTLAFVCFLRIDEVLTLQVHQIEMLYHDERQRWYMVFNLQHGVYLFTTC